MVTLCVPSGNADVSSTASHSPEPVLFPEAAGRLYECMKRHDDATYSVPDWAILAGLSLLDARRAAHWLAIMPDRRHPYIRRGPRVFSDEETYGVAEF